MESFVTLAIYIY